MSAALKSQPGTFSGEVSAAWLSRGFWLRRAWREIPSPELDQAKRGAALFARLQGAGGQDLDYAEGYALDSSFKSYTDPKTWKTLDDRRQQKRWRHYASNRHLAEINILDRLKGMGRGGLLLAYGSPQRVSEEPVWIPTASWQRLRPACREHDALEGGGDRYYNVRVVDPTGLHVAVVEPAKPSRARNAVTLRAFVKGYITETKLAAKVASESGAWKAWTTAELTGCTRAMVFSEFHRQTGAGAPTVGRPRKLATK